MLKEDFGRSYEDFYKEEIIENCKMYRTLVIKYKDHAYQYDPAIFSHKVV